MSVVIDRTGQRYGLLVAISHVGYTRNHNALWLCKCDCGKEINVSAGNLLRNTRSCGCIRKKTDSNDRYKKSDPEYNRRRRERRLELIRVREANGFAGFEHGVHTTYRAGCRCRECTDANYVHAKQTIEALKNDDVKRKCGTYAAWQSGCRCGVCVFESSLRLKSRRYKIPIEKLRSIVCKHSMKCDICGDCIKDKWLLDHCHSTGLVRGLVCICCNSGLGKFADNRKIMKAAIEYLCRNTERHGAMPVDADASNAEVQLTQVKSNTTSV